MMNMAKIISHEEMTNLAYPAICSYAECEHGYMFKLEYGGLAVGQFVMYADLWLSLYPKLMIENAILKARFDLLETCKLNT